MRLSVIVPAYNEASLILRCLEGLKAQTLPPQEVLLVDDSSTDVTVVKAESFARDNPGFPLRTVEHEKLGGYDILGNYTDLLLLGWSELDMRPDYFGICDADTVLRPNYYETILSSMLQDPKIGLAVCDFLPEAGMTDLLRRKKILGAYPYVYG